MSAVLLRQAATLMRERAEAATFTHDPWGVDEIGTVWAQEADGQHAIVSCRSTDQNAEHIASWHPAVALAVADWLDAMAARAESKIAKGGNTAAVWAHEIHALNVARAYLWADA